MSESGPPLWIDVFYTYIGVAAGVPHVSRVDLDIR
jgi:hypothetical protein